MSAGNRKRRRELGLLPDPARCVARKRDGTPCRGRPIAGASVCRMHGGSAPQVQRKAAERIANAADVAVLQIQALMLAPDTPAPVKLAAAKDLLDRADVKSASKIEVQLPWQELLTGIVAELPEGADVAMRPFAEAQDEEALKVASERFDAETAEVERAESARLLESYREERQDRSRPRRHEEPATPTLNGADRPPPRHPTPGPRRIEPDDRPPARRRIAGRR